jgi:hypothetical protein
MQARQEPNRSPGILRGFDDRWPTPVTRLNNGQTLPGVNLIQGLPIAILAAFFALFWVLPPDTSLAQVRHGGVLRACVPDMGARATKSG